MDSIGQFTWFLWPFGLIEPFYWTLHHVFFAIQAYRAPYSQAHPTHNKKARKPTSNPSQFSSILK
ncbi:hypothetical protein AAV98_13925 [Bacillus sp. CHD6a]|nr:hypothetical protein AAV98_13925 [Bacillus sp. CHD6a]